MMDLRAVREGLHQRLASVDGLRTYDRVPGSPNLPAAIVMPPESIDFDLAMGRALDRITLPIAVVVSLAPDGADATLDAYASSLGPRDLKDALEADRAQNGGSALSGACSDFRVTQARNFGPIRNATGEDVGVGFELLVEVIG